jgi:hypothetical protein
MSTRCRKLTTKRGRREKSKKDEREPIAERGGEETEG